ncbi:MAG: hypothetical protein RSF34_12060, partial [Flavobacterium sp.]|uniref:hypothetical protein n=1 Tax=Flavobacterium sp. TaxID=239 RepID=UPI002FC61702
MCSQQKEKVPVAEKDFHLWGNLYFDKISDYGNWASFRMHYDEHPDTLFVKNVATSVTYKLPLCTSGSFNKETDFASILAGKGIELINLKTGIRKRIPEVNAFNFTSNGKFLLTQRKAFNEKWLDIRNSNGVRIDSIAGINRIVLSPAGNMALCAVTYGQDSQLILISLGNTIEKKVILESKAGKFTHMVWQANSKSFAFLQHIVSDKKNEENNSIYYYRLNEEKIYYFNPSLAPDISKEDRISDTHQSKLTISDDGQRIFFGLEKKILTSQYDNDKVQIWNGNDAQLFPYRKEYMNYEILSKLTLWEPEKNRILHIGSDQRPYVVLSGAQKYAISFNPSERGIQYKESPSSNFYITNLSTGITRLWLENLDTNPSVLNMSPNGNYAAYFKDKNWWVYNFITDTHQNLTNNKIRDLYQIDKVQTFPIGFEGWTTDDKDVIIRDRYDLWKLSVKQSEHQRITSGREKNIRYNIKKIGNDLSGKRNFDGITGLSIDPQRLLVEASTNTGDTYYLLKGNQNLLPISGTGGLVSSLQKAKKNNTYIYMDEGFDRPPALLIKNIKNGTKNMLFQSNPQHFNYLWGKSESVEYVNSKNKKINSILYYPASYDSKNKYPMIVNIYEKWPNQLYKYYNPSNLLDIGMNVANFT